MNRGNRLRTDLFVNPTLHSQATDNEGRGLSTQVSLRIILTDANDNPPVFQHSHYRVAIDEGAKKFQQPLYVAATDPDKTSQVEYYIVSENVPNLFSLDPHSGEITVADKDGLNMSNVTTGTVVLVVQATDGKYSSNATVTISVNDVNNNAPVFEQESYVAAIPEALDPNSPVETVKAHDSDSGSNAEIKYHIQKGGFGDFEINELTGEVRVSKKLDYDRHQNYSIEIVAYDGGSRVAQNHRRPRKVRFSFACALPGVPKLTGTTTLTIQLINSNDKQPYFLPTTQRAEVSESAPVGEIVHRLHAVDPDVEYENALLYELSEPISAVDNNGKLVNDSVEFKVGFLQTEVLPSNGSDRLSIFAGLL